MREAEFERKPREDPLHDALLGEQAKEEMLRAQKSVRPAALHRLDPVHGLSRVYCESLLRFTGPRLLRPASSYSRRLARPAAIVAKSIGMNRSAPAPASRDGASSTRNGTATATTEMEMAMGPPLRPPTRLIRTPAP